MLENLLENLLWLEIAAVVALVLVFLASPFIIRFMEWWFSKFNRD